MVVDNEEGPIKTEGARVLRTLCIDAQRQVTP